MGNSWKLAAVLLAGFMLIAALEIFMSAGAPDALISNEWARSRYYSH